MNARKHPNTQYPKLRGRGSELKGVLHPVRAVWEKRKGACARDNMVSKSLDALCGLQEIMDGHKRDLFLPESAIDDFQRYTDIFLAEYSKLGVDADKSGVCLFTAAPKLHWFWHMSHRSAFLSPRKVATWAGEDFMKHMKKIANRACVGNRLECVPVKLMARYRWGLYIDMVSSLE